MAAQIAAHKQATEQAQRAAEEAKRNAEIQAQKQAAEETLRRAQEERNRLDQDRRLIENEKRAAEAEKKQAIEQAQRAAEEAKRNAEIQAQKQVETRQSAAHYDGTYNGKLCTRVRNETPNCWPVVLVVRDGVAEATWPTHAKKTATAKGTVAADGAVELKLSSWTPQGNPIDAILAGRVIGDTITASGHWANRAPVSGNWTRAQ